jgi:hypothetical protein
VLTDCALGLFILLQNETEYVMVKAEATQAYMIVINVGDLDFVVHQLVPLDSTRKALSVKFGIRLQSYFAYLATTYVICTQRDGLPSASRHGCAGDRDNSTSTCIPCSRVDVRLAYSRFMPSLVRCLFI